MTYKFYFKTFDKFYRVDAELYAGELRNIQTPVELGEYDDLFVGLNDDLFVVKNNQLQFIPNQN